MLYFFATGPELPRDTATTFFAAIGDSLQLFAVALPSAVLTALGFVLQGVGMIRARTLPLWVPVLSLVGAASLVLPANGWAGLGVGVPTAVASCAIAWFVRFRAPRP